MSDDRLTVQRQPEYIVIDRHKPRRTAMTTLLALVALICVGLGLASLRPKPSANARVFPDLSLPSIGLSASVRTKWIDNSGQYVFHVKPIPGTESRFFEVLKNDDLSQIKFTLHFEDADGFELCKVTKQVHRNLGSNGNAIALSSEGTLPTCSQDQFQRISKWHLSSTYPAVNADLTGVTSTKSGSSSQLSELTGSDFQTGRVETLDQGSFQVTRQAEYMTLALWRPSDVLSLSCNVRACVITNQSRGESVHATKE